MAAVVEKPPCVDEIEKLKREDPLDVAEEPTEQAKKKKKKKKKKKSNESPDMNGDASPESDIVQQMDSNTIEDQEGMSMSIGVLSIFDGNCDVVLI